MWKHLPLGILRAPLNSADQCCCSQKSVKPHPVLPGPRADSCSLPLSDAAFPLKTEKLPRGRHPDMREKALDSSSPHFSLPHHMVKSLNLPEPQFPHLWVSWWQSCRDSGCCVLHGWSSPGWPRHKDCILQSQGKCHITSPSLPKGTTHPSHVPSELFALFPLQHMFLPKMVWLVHCLLSQNESSRAAGAMPELTHENTEHA